MLISLPFPARTSSVVVSVGGEELDELLGASLEVDVDEEIEEVEEVEEEAEAEEEVEGEEVGTDDTDGAGLTKEELALSRH